MLPAKRFMTPEPRSHGSITGWRITTLNTRIPGWAIAHRESTLHHFNKPRVRSNGVNSTIAEICARKRPFSSWNYATIQRTE